MTEKEIDYHLSDLPRLLNNLSSDLERWAVKLKDTAGPAHSHGIGVLIGALRYRGLDLAKLAHALKERQGDKQ